jgi:methylated-DNA-[protein]-cysteine S-methyltransferase
MKNLAYRHFMSPVGELLLVGHEDGLVRIGFPEGKSGVAIDSTWTKREEPFREAVHQLDAYFRGTLREFDLPLLPEGTQFQMSVWKALQGIPYGTTVSYRDIAERIKNPKAVRAVGAANGRNPLPIVIPCHRVIGSGGGLTGYGGGLRIKEFLLRLEGADLAHRRPMPLWDR